MSDLAAFAERTPEWRAAKAAWEQSRPAQCPCGHPWDRHEFADLAVTRNGRVDELLLAFITAEGLKRWMVTCVDAPADASEEAGPWSYVCSCVGVWLEGGGDE